MPETTRFEPVYLGNPLRHGFINLSFYKFLPLCEKFRAALATSKLRPISLPRRRQIRLGLCLLCVFMLVLFACAGPDTKGDLKELSGQTIILVLPFRHIDTIDTELVFIDCKFCRGRHAFAAVSAVDAAFMSTRLMERLRNDRTYQYIFHDRADTVSPDLNFGTWDGQDLTPNTAVASNYQDVDAVLMGYIFRFRERVGTSYAIESPASVAFSILLIKKDDGRVIWHSRYEETQEALLSNLLTLGKFIKRRARWVTARELAADALEDMLSTFQRP